MFRKKREKALPEETLQEMVAESEKQKLESRAELHRAREVIKVLNDIREQNHIVSDLRKVFGGH